VTLCASDVCRPCHPSLALLSSVSINRPPMTTPHPALYECPRLSFCSLRLSVPDTQAPCLCHNIFSPSFNPFFKVAEKLKEEVARKGLHGKGRGEKSEKKKAIWRSVSFVLFLFFSCLSPSRLSSFSLLSGHSQRFHSTHSLSVFEVSNATA